MRNEIIVYTASPCPVCNMLKNFLAENDITYREINITFNPIAMAKMVKQSGKLSVPQTNLNGKWISGFDPVRILTEINKLDKV